MKKKKAKKAGGKKEEKAGAVAEATKSEEVKGEETKSEETKSEETHETAAAVPSEASTEVPLEAAAEASIAQEETTVEDEKKEEIPLEVSESKDEEEKVAELNSASRHGRSPSLSVQSKMRSSSFRQASGPLSPEIAFSPNGDTAPDIYRKQALRIEDLEKENKKLSKEAVDAEKRWKKAEEELEDLREAEGESAKGEKGTENGTSEEVEKLVSSGPLRTIRFGLIEYCRNLKSQRSNDKTHNFKFLPLANMYLRLRHRCQHHRNWKPSFVPNLQRSSLWKLRFLILERSLNVSHLDHLWKKNKSPLWRKNWQGVKSRQRMRNGNWEI